MNIGDGFPGILATIGVGLTLAGVILSNLWSLHQDMRDVRQDVTELRREFGEMDQRMSRIEGSLETLTDFLIARE